MQTLPLLAGENISHKFVAPIVASTIDLVVHTTILRDSGERRIVEIAHVTGRVEADRAEIEPLFTYENGRYLIGLGDPDRILRDKRFAKDNLATDGLQDSKSMKLRTSK